MVSRFRTHGLLATLTAVSMAVCTPAVAGDAPANGSVPDGFYDWRGFYAGAHLGGGLGLADMGDPYGRSIFGNTVRTPGPIAGGQAGYNWQHDAAVFGIEADASWADLGGTNTCYAYSGYFISSNCRAGIDALGTLTGRLGYVLPSDGKTLLYGKAGLAWATGDLQAIPNGGLQVPGTAESGTEWGWTVGGGVERALSPRWTVKAEYGFLSFDQGFVAPSSRVQPRPPQPGFEAAPSARTDLSQNVHLIKLGVNYRLGPAAEMAAGASGDSASTQGTLARDTMAPGYALTTGARYVYGWGQFHKDLGIPNQGLGSLASRLTYENTDTHGGEAFARLDTPFGLVVKGLVGGGSSSGALNDEDWDLEFGPNEVPYSNTLSGVDNDIRYGIVDVGYALWRGPTHSITPFVGYARFEQDMTGLGCRQIANRYSDCNPAFARSVRGITEDDTWQALRLGAAAEAQIAPRMSLTADAAYLPYVAFDGTDDHILRNLVSPEDGDGIGVQLEATLSYALTDAFSIGVGGRYWAMWTTQGTVNFGGTGTIIPMRYAAEQAQLLVQGSYRFGGP
ncbi:outer membrane beta-barrel protein [Methyloceanibacter sp. wino2]|uniref:outer membrane beta-barrel protein n=1 Tax=Methyloceanibacter sp. wino2 TaxID=2170729 RepID=UPI00131EEDB2|nr:outer membrane beta-barrel protein [Methyloceanibacter sp. wino2]